MALSANPLFSCLCSNFTVFCSVLYDSMFGCCTRFCQKFASYAVMLDKQMLNFMSSGAVALPVTARVKLFWALFMAKDLLTDGSTLPCNEKVTFLV